MQSVNSYNKAQKVPVPTVTEYAILLQPPHPRTYRTFTRQVNYIDQIGNVNANS
jgi:hypothetical protein